MSNLRKKLSNLLRAVRAELPRLRGEVITALTVAGVIAVLIDDGAARVLGTIAVITTGLGLLALSARMRPRGATPNEPNNRPATPSSAEDSGQQARLDLARARLRETASSLGLRVSPGPTTTEPGDFRPLVSVVVPCFNDAEFVEAALESLRRQTYDAWECVVVDDASTDSSWDLIRAATEDDSRFKTMRMDTNSGSGAARNRGLEAATGEYLAFLDADDLLLRESLRDRVTTLSRHLGDETVAGSFCAVRSSPQDVSLDSLPDRRHATQPDFIDFVVAGGECPFTLHAPLVAIDRVRALGGFDESMTGGGVDWDLWYRMLRNGNVFVPSRALGAIYRQKGGGITRSNKAEHTAAGAALIRAAFASVDPAIMTAPTSFPMPEPLGVYESALVVADRAIRFAAMALADGDVGGMRKTLDVLDRGQWPLLDRHLDWSAVVGRGVARVIGLRPKDVDGIADELAPFVDTIRSASEEASR